MLKGFYNFVEVASIVVCIQTHEPIKSRTCQIYPNVSTVCTSMISFYAIRKINKENLEISGLYLCSKNGKMLSRGRDTCYIRRINKN